MALQRYPQDELVTSSQSGFTDLSDWLSFLTAKEYLKDLLIGSHGLAPGDAEARCGKIIPHVRMALNYIRQAVDGPAEISFLPAYYAILNLMKVCVLFGPRHVDLARNRWHGATYDPQGRNSRSVMTEEIMLKSGGVFPLYYETITGSRFRARSLRVRVGEFLGCVSGVQFEYRLATGTHPALCQLQFNTVNADQTGQDVRCAVMTLGGSAPAGRVECLASLRPDPGNRAWYIGPRIPNLMPNTVTAALRSSIKTHLLYRLEPINTYTVVTGSRLELPQELPIAMLFFYMSSVVRYRPEYFARLRDSKFWPVLSSARLHSFLDFLLCFWSFAHKRNYFINAPIYNSGRAA